MRAWIVDFGGGLESLRRVEVPRPVPGPGQVLVAVEAVSLNRRELSVLEGRYPLPVKDTLIPVCDGVGTIVEVGEGVARLRVGDRVIGAVFPTWFEGPFSLERSAQLGGSLDGMLAEYVCLDAEASVPVPESVPVVQAACLPCAGVTAWHALHTGPALRPGDTVLSTTSGGGSVYVVQLAKALGYRVIVATSARDRAAALTELGADHVLTTAAGPDEVLELTGGRGADLTVHLYGDLDRSVASTRFAGSVALVSPTGSSSIDPLLAFARNVAIHPVALGGCTTPGRSSTSSPRATSAYLSPRATPSSTRGRRTPSTSSDARSARSSSASRARAGRHPGRPTPSAVRGRHPLLAPRVRPATNCFCSTM